VDEVRNQPLPGLRLPAKGGFQDLRVVRSGFEVRREEVTTQKS
jgi:hypothetical protein